MAALTSAPALIYNVTLADAHTIAEDAWIRIADGRIHAMGRGSNWRTVRSSTDELIDGDGGWVTPGFIDLHFHGGGGYSNEDGRFAIMSALTAHHAHGTTRAVVSFVSNPIKKLQENVAIVAELTGTTDTVLGSHLEGPYLAMDRKGAHKSEHLRAPETSEVLQLIKAGKGTIRQVTLDPDRNGSLAAITTFKRAGIVVGVGHTSANYEQASKAFQSGASLLTHTFNAMPGIHHREPGPIVAALDHGAILELILDGIHVHPRVAALLFKLAPHQIILVSDSMAAAGAADGTYELGDLQVVASGGTALLAGTNTLAGSRLTLNSAIRLGLGQDIPLKDLLRALTLTPARMLGRVALGLLKKDFEADVVIFDRNWDVQRTFVRGRSVYAKQGRKTICAPTVTFS